MPYQYPKNIPDKIKDLPAKAQQIWVSAFNSALEQYNGDEAVANKVAWGAVKSAGYVKRNGEWVKNSDSKIDNKEIYL